MHVNVCVGVVVIVLVLVQQSRGGEDREGRRCTRQAGPGRPCGVVHAFATYLSRAHDPGWRVRAGGRSARPGCRLRAGMQACRRVGVWAWAVRGSQKPPSQRQMRDETTRRHETGCWPGDASFGRQDATKTSQQPRPIPPPPPRPPWPMPISQQQPATTPQQQPHPHPHSHPRRQPQRSGRLQAAVGPGGISAVPSCPVPGPGCRTCHLLAMPS
jgi:hypothetical protein